MTHKKALDALPANGERRYRHGMLFIWLTMRFLVRSRSSHYNFQLSRASHSITIVFAGRAISLRLRSR